MNTYTPIDKTKDLTADDTELANAIIATVQTVKDWAQRGAEKLDDSISRNPFVGRTVKEVLQPLIGSDGYRDKAKDVRGKFRFSLLYTPPPCSI